MTATARAAAIIDAIEAGLVMLRPDTRRLIEELTAYTPPRRPPMQDTTAALSAGTLASMVALVERFALYDDGVLDDWTVYARRDLPVRMLVRWDTSVTVRDRGDLELARRIAVERATGVSYVRTATALARAALGWGQGEPGVRCVVCRVSAPASAQHVPGGRACADTREERRVAHSD